MRKKILLFCGLVVIVLIGAGIWLIQPETAKYSVDAVAGRVPKLSQPDSEFFPTIDVPEAVGWAKGEKPTPAKGLAVSAFADGLDHPRWLYRLPNGDILAAETNAPASQGGGIAGWIKRWRTKKAGEAYSSPNRIVLLRDSDGDGKADQRSIFLNGLNSPFGMQLVGKWLYVANTDSLVRYPYQDGETRITAKPEKILDLPSGGDHWARNVLYNPNDKSLWVSVGSATNIANDGLDKEQDRAAIYEVDPEKKTFRIWAGGMPNPVGMAVNPVSKRIWAVVDERDLMGPDMPPDYLTQVDFAAFFGWPWAYWGGYEDKRVEPRRPDLLEYVMRPDFSLGPHVTPMGLAFARGADLGPAFVQGAFVGEHGSWNRKPLSGYKVVFVPFADTGFPEKSAKPRDVLTGFVGPDGKARGRPTGVVTDQRGGLLVADDIGNVIWRVSAARTNGAAPAQSSEK